MDFYSYHVTVGNHYIEEKKFKEIQLKFKKVRVFSRKNQRNILIKEKETVSTAQ